MGFIKSAISKPNCGRVVWRCEYEFRGWHSRGYLPHFDSSEVVQTVTFRLHDSLPWEKLEAWRNHPRCKNERSLANAIENYLDRSCGACYLQIPRIAALVESTLLFFDGERFRMLAWTIMPNHVHAMLEIRTGFVLSEVVHSWKSYSANRANQLLKSNGHFWQEDYFDRFIRNEAHYRRALHYIENNAVKAKLCANAQDWPFCSANLRGAGILPTSNIQMRAECPRPE